MKEILKQIKEIKIQGASNVAKASIGLLSRLPKSDFQSKGKFINKAEKIKKTILDLRPTEPLVSNFYYLMIQSVGLSKAASASELKRFVGDKIKEIINFYDSQEKKLVKNGVKLIKANDTIFTHCHSSIVEKILVAAKKNGKNFRVYNSETRPLFQGRITATNLSKRNINVTMVSDSAAPFLVSDHSGDKVKIDKVIIGSDAIGLNGTAVNKIGSFGITLTAWESKIPVYVAASLMKIDSKSHKKISLRLEKRKASEIWPGVKEKIKIENYAFDFIPNKFITGYITEFGLLKPSEIRKKVKKEYPCLF